MVETRARRRINPGNGAAEQQFIEIERQARAQARAPVFQPQAQPQYNELQSGYEGGPFQQQYQPLYQDQDQGQDQGQYQSEYQGQGLSWQNDPPQVEDNWPQPNPGLLNSPQLPFVLQDVNPAAQPGSPSWTWQWRTRAEAPLDDRVRMFRQNSFSQPVNRITPCLEELGWEQKYSEKHNKVYYYNNIQDRWQWAMPSCDEGFSNKSSLPSLLTLGFLAAAALIAMRVSKNI